MSNPRREQTRERLIRAAVDVFAEKGIGAATVADICEEAGFTRGAFYSNFETKRDLCIAIAAEFHAARTGAMHTAVELCREFPTTEDPLVVAKRVIETYLVQHELRPEVVMTLLDIRLEASRDRVLGDELARLQRESGAVPLEHVLQGALATTGYEFVVDVDTVFEAVEWVIARGVMRPFQAASIDEAISKAAALALAMVRPIGAQTAGGSC